jgi:hypothetical protein
MENRRKGVGSKPAVEKRQLVCPLGGEGIATMKRLQNLLPNTLGACGEVLQENDSPHCRRYPDGHEKDQPAPQASGPLRRSGVARG